MNIGDLLAKVKSNLIIDFTDDDELLENYIKSAISYAESYQHLEENYYENNEMSGTTEQAIIMLVTHFYESRDGSTAGFFADNVQASQQVWKSANMLLQIDRNWKL